MEEHEQNTHIKNICTFEGCGKEFKFRLVLREHRKTHYPADCDWMADPDPDMTIDRFFVCTYCGKRYFMQTSSSSSSLLDKVAFLVMAETYLGLNDKTFGIKSSFFQRLSFLVIQYRPGSNAFFCLPLLLDWLP